MARRNSDGDLESFVRGICEQAINEYVDIIWGIANDIYDSCIKQYYASYTPTVYKRHGNIEGENLYRANSFTLGGLTLNEMNNMGIKNPLELDNLILDDFNEGMPEALSKYKTKEDIRAEVLNNVLSGQRGRSDPKNERTRKGKKKIRRRPIPTDDNPEPGEWPRPWTASYPNSYSKHHEWHSGKHTMKEIIADFEANILDDTSDLLDKLIDKQFK